MSFVHDMIKMKRRLNKLGHKVSIPFGTELHLTDKDFVDKLEENLKRCIKNNVMKTNFDLVAKHEAILVLNHEKNNTDGYIGISVLMEMAVAHHLDKKIFLFNPYPDYNKFRWAHEVAIMQPTVINGNLKKIK